MNTMQRSQQKETEPQLSFDSSSTASEQNEARWQAVLARDKTQDGQFYTGVSSTGIYCRPSCPARHPRRENVRFFETLDAAEAAGFRACLRCHPREVNPQAQLIAQLRELIEQAETPPTLEELGAAVGLSPFYVQRRFKAATGLSPKQYALARRGERLRAELQAAGSVTTAMYDAGHGSSHSLYAPATSQLGMTPGAYRAGGAGQHISYSLGQSELGTLLIASTERGLCAVRFGEPDTLPAELKAEFPRAELTRDDAALAPQRAVIEAELAGRPAAPLATDAAGSDFQRRVWDALGRIPRGETRSYAQLAAMIGEPQAVRAVAGACARNPLALVVPCHRVLRSDGALGGYRWGLERKRALLASERSGAA